MSFTVEMDVLGAEKVSRRLLRIGGNLDNMRPAWMRVLDLVEGQAQAQFDSKGGQSGGWAQRKDSNPWPLMEKTGALLAGLVNQAEANATNDGADFTAGQDTPYWVYHHSTKPRTKLPRRPLLVVDEPLRRQVMRTLQAHTFAGR